MSRYIIRMGGTVRLSDTRDTRKLLELARRLHKAGDFARAEELFRKAISWGADSANTWFSLSMTLKKAGKNIEALESLNKVVDLDEKHEMAWYEIGLCLLMLRRFEDSLGALDRALSINPKFRQAWHNKASVLEKLGKLREARIAYEKANLAREGKEVPSPEEEKITRPGVEAGTPGPGTGVHGLLVQAMESLMESGGGSLVIVTSKLLAYKSCLVVIQFLIEEMDMDGVVVSVDKPAFFTLRALNLRSKARIKPFFVDLQSGQDALPPMTKIDEGRIVNTEIYDLHSIQEKIEEQLQKAAESYGGEEHFVLFDDLTALEYYNNPDVIKKFANGIIEKLRAHNLFAIFILSKEKVRDLFSPILGRSHKKVEFSPDMLK
jgi:tetratricopeptide (TPR) repeat protein